MKRKRKEGEENNTREGKSIRLNLARDYELGRKKNMMIKRNKREMKKRKTKRERKGRGEENNRKQGKGTTLD